jgi:hypothetical protein
MSNGCVVLRRKFDLDIGNKTKVETFKPDLKADVNSYQNST